MRMMWFWRWRLTNLGMHRNCTRMGGESANRKNIWHCKLFMSGPASLLVVKVLISDNWDGTKWGREAFGIACTNCSFQGPFFSFSSSQSIFAVEILVSDNWHGTNCEQNERAMRKKSIWNCIHKLFIWGSALFLLFISEPFSCVDLIAHRWFYAGIKGCERE